MPVAELSAPCKDKLQTREECILAFLPSLLSLPPEPQSQRLKYPSLHVKQPQWLMLYVHKRMLQMRKLRLWGERMQTGQTSQDAILPGFSII